MPVLQLSEDLQGMKIHLLESQKRKSETMKPILSSKSPEASTDLAHRLDQLQVSFILADAIEHIARGILGEAKREIERAMGITVNLNDEISIARCHYWMGRVEIERNNLPLAYEYFMDARPCVMSEKYPEGQSLEYYLKLAKSGGNEHESRQPPDHIERESRNGGQRSCDVSETSRSPMKRKRDRKTWDLVLRPVKSEGCMKIQQGAAREKQKSTSRATTWIVRDREDVLHPNNPLALAATDENHLEWPQKVNTTHVPPKSRYFTFRCYPRGLASRTRTTEIFSEQPGENLLSADAWVCLRERTKNQRLTLQYLENELLRNIKQTKSRLIANAELGSCRKEVDEE
ncbi:hypothetical protein N7478_011606 [Penicillium angulare]|uniref:uncharacterized protein n=1 Tax=Penicillium angulare TaxID=116970 RepID=UPI00254128D4|nr:uncharacterized protein N7478_011606 [Penicillium angulare]KAJ5261011.1 hypothetical protein N7478_011606 [Penicillium angulare]